MVGRDGFSIPSASPGGRPSSFLTPIHTWAFSGPGSSHPSLGGSAFPEKGGDLEVALVWGFSLVLPFGQNDYKVFSTFHVPGVSVGS